MNKTRKSDHKAKNKTEILELMRIKFFMQKKKNIKDEHFYSEIFFSLKKYK